MTGLGPIDDLVAAFGPFVLPVLLFVAGLVGYGVLVALGRADVPTEDTTQGRESASDDDDS